MVFLLKALKKMLSFFEQSGTTGSSPENDKPIYLTVEEIIIINERVTNTVGLLCSHSKLESALNRPGSAHYYEQADIIRQAALLTDGICMAHAFIDGNKRTAVIACTTFLRLNFCDVAGVENQIGTRVEALVKEHNLDDFTQWLREHTKLL